MSNSLTQETTSLQNEIFESTLEWNIENFKEYYKCNIGSITSRKIQIEGTGAYWTLSVFPNGYHSTSPTQDNNHFSVSVQIKDKNPSENHYFKIEVKTNAHDHKNLSPHSLEESDGFLSSLNSIQPVTWTTEYENIGKETHLEFFEDEFISVHDMPKYLIGGTLKLLASVTMKDVEITDHVKGERKRKFH